MLKIAVIGVGNAGNQVADYANLQGIDGLAINTSEKDLMNLVTKIPAIIVGDEKGAGKDRSIAKSFIQKCVKDVLDKEELKNVMSNNEVIFVVSSTGGGTGSGICPVLIDILSKVYSGKHFILVGILPPVQESIAAQQNTIEYLKEMRNSNPTYMLYDNNNFSHLPVDQMLTAVNNEIVQDMLVIRGDYQHSTPFNSIDEKDMLKLIKTNGRLSITRITGIKEKDVDEKSIEDRLIDTTKSNAHSELDRDQIIKRLGVIVNLNKKVYETLDTNLMKFKGLVGEPIEGFEHIFIKDENDDTIENRVIAVLSGLSVPDDRIQKIFQRIEDATTALTKVKESSILDSTPQLDIINSLREDAEKESSVSDVNLDEIFSKY